MTRLICLANSNKTGGRCIAGKTLGGIPAWIRPVSDRENEEVYWSEQRCQDGTDTRVLDIIDIPLLNHRPSPPQTENWLLEPGSPWQRVGAVSWDDLASIADAPPDVWVPRGDPRSAHDRVAAMDAPVWDQSLYLLHLRDLSLEMGVSPFTGRRTVRAEFSYRRLSYDLSLTDTRVREEYRRKELGSYKVGECFATVSLAKPFTDGYCYKVVAGLMARP